METIKKINRTINFETRQPSSRYRCKYGDKNDFDILQINIRRGNYTETYKIESQYLPDNDSIYFNARSNSENFEVYNWTKSVEGSIKKV